MTQKIIRTGNSAAVTIPAEFVEALSLRIGDQVEAEMDDRKGAVTYKFPNSRQLPLGRGTKGTKKRKRIKGKKDLPASPSASAQRDGAGGKEKSDKK